jgi:hypothetical protein
LHRGDYLFRRDGGGALEQYSRIIDEVSYAGIVCQQVMDRYPVTGYFWEFSKVRSYRFVKIDQTVTFQKEYGRRRELFGDRPYKELSSGQIGVTESRVGVSIPPHQDCLSAVGHGNGTVEAPVLVGRLNIIVKLVLKFSASDRNQKGAK